MGKLSRKTRQKRLLQDEAEKFTTFFRAEELFHSARKKDKGIGMATVYRFLNDSRRKKPDPRLQLREQDALFSKQQDALPFQMH